METRSGQLASGPVGDRPVIAPAPPARTRLRVAFFTDTFPPTHDGVANVTETLGRALRRSGHEVTVFTVRPRGTERSESRDDGLRIRRFLALPAPKYPQYLVALFPWTATAMVRRRFDVVHVHTPGFVGVAGWLAARTWRLPIVGTYHTHLAELLRGSGRSRVSRAFYRAWGRFSIDLCRSSELATAPTASAARLLQRSGRPARSGPPRVVENGVDTETFRPGISAPDWRARLGSTRPTLVTFLGRLTRDKGVHRFLDAVERLRNDTPWIAILGGEGPQRAAMAARMRSSAVLSVRARYVGPVAEAEKPALLAQTSVFVLPSLSDTSSVALLEAMSAGAACVVTSHGGPGEIAQRSEACRIVDPDDAAGVAAAIDQLLADPNSARQLAHRARAWVVEHGSAGRMADEFLSSYRAVLEPDGPG